MKGQLPKAYLRLDPNIDRNPDMPLLVRIICEANRQDPRGRFRGWERVVLALGKVGAARARERGHIVEQPGGVWVVGHWDHWQEGDLTVGERMKRLRERKRMTVTPAVTIGVTQGVTVTAPPSEASGVKALGTETEDDDRARESRTVDGFRCPACECRGTLYRSQPRGDQPAGWFCGTRVGGCGAKFLLADARILPQLSPAARASIERDVATTPTSPPSNRRPTAAEVTVAAVRQIEAEEDAKERQRALLGGRP